MRGRAFNSFKAETRADLRKAFRGQGTPRFLLKGDDIYFLGGWKLLLATGSGLIGFVYCWTSGISNYAPTSVTLLAFFLAIGTAGWAERLARKAVRFALPFSGGVFLFPFHIIRATSDRIYTYRLSKLSRFQCDERDGNLYFSIADGEDTLSFFATASDESRRAVALSRSFVATEKCQEGLPDKGWFQKHSLFSKKRVSNFKGDGPDRKTRGLFSLVVLFWLFFTFFSASIAGSIQKSKIVDEQAIAKKERQALAAKQLERVQRQLERAEREDRLNAEKAARKDTLAQLSADIDSCSAFIVSEDRSLTGEGKEIAELATSLDRLVDRYPDGLPPDEYVRANQMQTRLSRMVEKHETKRENLVFRIKQCNGKIDRYNSMK